MNITVVVTGSLSAAYTPYWMQYCLANYADHTFNYALTPTALRFVALDTVRALAAGGTVTVDSWSTTVEAMHVKLASCDAIVVHPASYSYLSTVGSGLANSPSQLALVGFTGPVRLCPSLPPGVAESNQYRELTRLIAEHGNWRLFDPIAGRSATLGCEVQASAPPPLSLALDDILGTVE